MTLGKKVFNSAFLLFIRKIWGNIVNLIVMAFLARILSKEDFGLLAISSVFLSIINTVATSGIAEFLVYYDKEDRAEKVNAAFWMNMGLTLAVIATVIVTGPAWAEFYNNDKIYFLLLLLAVSFFFEMNTTIPKAILRKDLEYKSLVYFSTVSMTLVSVGKLSAALSGFGAYSLALPQAIVSPVFMLLFFFKTKWKPAMNFGVIHFKTIFNYSKHIIGGRVLTKLVNEGDNLIVGKFIGMEGLGIYALAFQLANLVTTNVVFIVNDIFLPIFSKVKNDFVRLKEIYLRMIQFLSFVSFPLITTLAISAKSIVFFIYGEKWLDAVLPFQILCAFALARSISSPSSALFSAMGRPDIGFKFTAYFTPVFLLAVWLGSYYGVIGVAISTSVVRFLGSLVSLKLSLSLIGTRLRELIKLIISNLTATVLILIFSLIFLRDLPDWSLIIMILLIPVIIYIHLLLQRVIYTDQFNSFLNETERFVKFKITIIKRLFFIKA